MGLNIKSAITYMFKDKDCKKKLLTGSLFMIGVTLINILSSVVRIIGDLIKDEHLKPYLHLLPQFLIIGLVVLAAGCVLNIFTSGYFAKNINLRIFKPDAELLPWNDWGNMFWTGLKSTIATCIYIVVFLLISIPPFIFIVAVFCNNWDGILFFLTLTILSIIFFVFFAIVFAAASLAFSTDLKFLSFFNFSLIKKFITKNFFEFFIYLVLLYVLQIMVNIVNLILTLTIAGIICIPFALFYQYLAMNDLAAQFIRNTLDMNKSDQEQNNDIFYNKI